MPSFYTAVGGAVVGGRTGSTPTAPLLAVGTGAQYLHRTGTRSRLAATVFTRVDHCSSPILNSERRMEFVSFSAVLGKRNIKEH